MFEAGKIYKPILWLIVGTVGLYASAVSIIDGETLVPVPALFRVFQGMSSPKIHAVEYAREPRMFVAWIVIAIGFSIFALAFGTIGLVQKARARMSKPKFQGILSR